MTEEPRRPQINWSQVFGGALAAVSSAVLLSTVGVAGTIIGAALGSVVLTLGKEIYSYYLNASKRQLAKVHDQALTRVVHARVVHARATVGGRAATDHDPGRVDAELAPAGKQLEQAKEELEDETPPPRAAMWRELLSGLPWRRIGPSAGGIFLLAIGIITAFELTTGRDVSEFTGGSPDHQGPRTSIVGLVVGEGGNAPSKSPSAAGNGSPTPGHNGQVQSPSASTAPSPSATVGEQSTPTSFTSSTPSPQSQPSSQPSSAAPTPTPASSQHVQKPSQPAASSTP